MKNKTSGEKGMQKHSNSMPKMKGMPDKNTMVKHMKSMGKMTGNSKM